MVASDLRCGFMFYDLEMRKFIKENYGVEIENPVKKWGKLCWNCYAAVADLKKCPKCAKCRIARYCGKDCQDQDWKFHEIIHQNAAHM